MVEESTMRQGMDTWLKEECLDTGISFMHLSAFATDMRNHIFHNNRTGAMHSARGFVDKLRELVEKGYITSEEVALYKDRIDIAVGRLPGIVEGSREWVDVGFDVTKVISELDIKTLERTVECQCGKPGEEKYAPPTIKFPETEAEWHSLGEKIKSERYHRYGERDKAFEDELDNNVYAIKHNLPLSEFAKRWLVAKAGELDIKEY